MGLVYSSLVGKQMPPGVVSGAQRVPDRRWWLLKISLVVTWESVPGFRELGNAIVAAMI